MNQIQITHDGLAKANVLSDGSYVYVSETSKGRHIISKVAVDGTGRSRLALPFAGAIGDALAPDRATILLSTLGESRDALWTLSLPNGAPRLLRITGRNAAWSPDAQQITYANDSALYVANSDGAQSREVASVSGTVF